MTVIYIDMQDVRDKDDFFRTVQEALPIPAIPAEVKHTIRNLDALYDVLTEYGWDWDIIIFNTKRAEEALGPYFQRFRQVCSDAAENMDGLKIRIYP